MWRPERRRPARIAIRQAVALGALHGPAELLPVSSSGHLAAIPWLLRWSYTEVDDATRKSFEVALHAGTGAALVIARRGELALVRDPQALWLIALASLPPALAGYRFETAIEERLGTPATIAAGLVAGSLAMALGDGAPEARRIEDARAADAVWLGVAQAVALVPGVSRQGATLAAARWRRFRRSDAFRLSALVGLPPIAGATALRALRHRPPGGAAFVAGGLAAFGSTLASQRLIRLGDSGVRLWPFSVYRLALAGAIALRLRRGSRALRRRPPRL